MKKKENLFCYPVCADSMPIARSRFRDIDEQAAQLCDHDQRYRQLSCGAFDGTFLTVALGFDEWLYLEDVNQALIQEGSGPANASSFLILLREDEHCRFQNAAFTSSDLAMIPAGSEFSVASPANTGFCVITLHARTIEGTTGAGVPSHHACRLSSPAIGYAVQALRMLVRSSVAMSEQEDYRTGTAPLTLVRRSLVSTLGLALSSVPPRQAVPPSPALFRRAMTVIDGHLDAVDVPALCRMLDVPRRTIEDAFRREVGFGPARVIKMLRLNRIRRDIAIEPPDVPLADIAARWGLWHPSHFTDDYHAMFGERPSETRKGAGTLGVAV